MLERKPVKSKESYSSVAFFFLVLYTIFIFIRPHEIVVEYSDWYIIQVLTISCLFLFLFFHKPLYLAPQFWMFMCLLPLVMVSAFLNGYGSQGFSQVEKIILSLIVPFFFFSNALTNIKRQKIMMWLSILASLLMIHNGYTQFNSFDGLGWAGNSQLVGGNDRGSLGRITYIGFFSDPNDLGLLIVMNIPLLMFFFVNGGVLKKILMICILCVFIYGIYLTGSRGTMLGAASLIVVYYLVFNARNKTFITAILLTPIVATLLFSLSGIGQQDQSASGRLEAWYDGINILVANPVFGIGMGNFLDAHGITAHNSYILSASELGVPGYTLWGGALLLTVFTSYLIIKEQQRLDKDKPMTLNETEEDILNTEELLMNKCLFFSMVGFMVTAFFLSRTYLVILYIFMGMVVASNMRIFKRMPEYAHIKNNSGIVINSMIYSWSIIIAVYLSLKIGL